MNSQNPPYPSSTRSYALLSELRRQGCCERCGKQQHSSVGLPHQKCQSEPPVSDDYVLNVPMEEMEEIFMPVVHEPEPDDPWPPLASLQDKGAPSVATGAFDDEFVSNGHSNDAPMSVPVVAEENEGFANELAAAVAAAYCGEDAVSAVNNTVSQNGESSIPADSAIPQKRETSSSVHVLSLGGPSPLNEGPHNDHVKKNPVCYPCSHECLPGGFIIPCPPRDDFSTSSALGDRYW